MLFLAEFLRYLIIFVVLVALAVIGALIGKTMRVRKDAKTAAYAADGEASTVDEDKQ